MIINLKKTASCKKNSTALFKMASVKKLWNQTKVGGQEMAVAVLVDGKNFTRIQVILCCLIPASLGISTKFTWSVLTVKSA